VKDSPLVQKLKLAAANLSPPTLEIVKMSEAGTDPATIRAFVESSTIAYNPKAEEIIYLHDHGISDSIITAMIQHGARIREQTATAPAAPATPPPPPNTDPYPVEASAPPYIVSPTYSSPAYYPTYPYPYPVYWSPGYVSFGAHFSRPFYGRSFGAAPRFSTPFRAGHSFIRGR